MAGGYCDYVEEEGKPHLNGVALMNTKNKSPVNNPPQQGGQKNVRGRLTSLFMRTTTKLYFDYLDFCDLSAFSWWW